MPRVVAILSLPAVVLVSCSTVPSTPGSDFSGNSRRIGELQVLAPLVISGGTDGAPALPTLPPGRYAARLDRLQKDEIVVEIDAPEVGDLIVRLEEGAGEFPVGDGGFAFTASQHDLPYTMYGEHEVTRTLQSSTRVAETCYIEELRQVCSENEDGTSTCSVYTVRVPGTQWFERRVTQEREDFGFTFVDAQAAAVVARFQLAAEPWLEVRQVREGGCRY